MANYLVKGRRITLSGNPDMGTYTVEIAGRAWTMSERPYVRFADGTVVPFPAPETEGPCKTGTTEGIAAVYTNFGGHKITVRTKAEIETITDDVYFTLLVEGDEKCEIDRVSFPAPFDFGTAYGD